jgi:hypothetical protein
MRMDSGFWANDTITTLKRLDVRFTMAVRCGFKAVAAAIESIDEDAWVDIAYPDGGVAQVAETDLHDGSPHPAADRAPHPPHRPCSATLWPDWRHHAFLTDIVGDPIEVDRFHRQHATIELAIRDLKQGVGTRPRPVRTVPRQLGVAAMRRARPQPHPLDSPARRAPCRRSTRRDRTIRTRLLALPARLVNRSGRATLRMPRGWPWAHQFVTALNALRDLQPATG